MYPIILWVTSMQGIQSSLRELQPNIFRYCSIISIRVIVTVRKLFVTVSSRVTTGDCARLIPLSPVHVHPSTHRLHTCTVCECMMFELTALSDDCRAGVYSLTPSSSGEWAPPPISGHADSHTSTHVVFLYSLAGLIMLNRIAHVTLTRDTPSLTCVTFPVFVSSKSSLCFHCALNISIVHFFKWCNKINPHAGKYDLQI